VSTDERTAHDSYLDFYRTTYGSVIADHRVIAGAGDMVLAVQSAGDWSDAPTPDLVVGFVDEGRGEYTADLGCGRFRSRFRPGETILIPPNSGNSIQCDGAHSIVVQSIRWHDLVHLAGDDLALPAGGDFGHLHAGPLGDPFIATALARVWKENAAASPANALFNQGALLATAALLVKLSTDRPPVELRGGLAAWQVRKATALLEARMEEPIGLDRLAAETGLSPFHFARAFKRTTGLPPHRYQIMLRIERAKDLLANSHRSIADVAAAVGYTDQSQLARLFRKEVGMTPLAYRRERRR
jgi:AraC family transcriptional regulator